MADQTMKKPAGSDMMELVPDASGKSGRRLGWLAYAGLALVWSLLSGWQIYEHCKMKNRARSSLLERAADISATLEVVIRSQVRFGAVSRKRLQAALTELSETNDVLSVALFSPSGDMVASAGEPFSPELLAMAPGQTYWGPRLLALAEPLRLRPINGEGPEGEEQRILIIERPPRPEGEGEPPPAGDDQSGPPAPGTEGDSTDRTPDQRIPPFSEQPPAQASSDAAAFPEPPRDGPPPEFRPDFNVDDMTPEQMKEFIERIRQHRRDWGRPRRPPWLSEERFQELFEKFGLQKFVIALSSAETGEMLRRDVWQRAVFASVAFVAVLALAMRWQAREKTSELQVRLARAGEMNNHLREMNTAAAGLAHETRNPLNVVRGLAQIIRDRGQPAGAGSRKEAETIIEEVDRVNSRLDQFICYARPCEPQLGNVNLDNLVRAITTALQYDIEEKHIEVVFDINEIGVLADAEMLRQVVFNLILNACQAVPDGGHITIAARADGPTCTLIVSDDGPGVPADRREDIFRPYVTFSEKGTGLGLAIVRQIVLAHHWEIECTRREPGGVAFVIHGMARVVA